METLKLGGHVPALVTNIETLQLLTHKIKRRNEAEEKAAETYRKTIDSGPAFSQRDWIERKVVEYLHMDTAAGMFMTNGKVDVIPNLVQTLQASSSSAITDNNSHDEKEETTHNNHPPISGFELTDAETLQILNIMPKEVVDLHLMIQDLQERMSEERQEELLRVIASYAGEPMVEVPPVAAENTTLPAENDVAAENTALPADIDEQAEQAELEDAEMEEYPEEEEQEEQVVEEELQEEEEAVVNKEHKVIKEDPDKVNIAIKEDPDEIIEEDPDEFAEM